MPKITKFRKSKDGERIFVFLDGDYATSVRERVFGDLKLSIGLEITKAEITEREKFYWKTKYQKNGGWEREKHRLNRITACVNHANPDLIVNVTGFGARSTDFIARHPDVAGTPDLEVSDQDGNLIACVEVTGTENMRGGGYWVRPDKIEWVRNNPDIDAWVALHYSKPKESILFFRPDLTREYEVREVKIGDSRERFVILGDEDVIGWRDFVNHIRAKNINEFNNDCCSFV